MKNQEFTLLCNGLKIIISFFDIDKRDYFLVYDWQDSTWFPYYGNKNEYIYDGLKLTEFLDITWDTTIGDWRDRTLFKYSNFRLFLNTEEHESNVKALEKLKIYPNPGKKEIFVELGSGGKIDKIDIFDPQGKNMFSKTYNHKQAKRVKINISQYPKGVYIVKATSSGNFQHNGKLIVE